VALGKELDSCLVSRLREEARVSEAQLRRELKQLEYSLQAEELKTGDLRCQLERERTTCFEYVQKMAEAKKQSGLLAVEVGELRESVERLQSEGEEGERTGRRLKEENERLVVEMAKLRESFKRLETVKEENERLVVEMAKLRESIKRLEAVKEENERLVVEQSAVSAKFIIIINSRIPVI